MGDCVSETDSNALREPLLDTEPEPVGVYVAPPVNTVAVGDRESDALGDAL